MTTWTPPEQMFPNDWARQEAYRVMIAYIYVDWGDKARTALAAIRGREGKKNDAAPL